MTHTNSVSLPPGFSELERYVSTWGQASTDARHHHRQMSSMDAIQEFYDAFQPRLEAVFKHLDPLDVWTLPMPEQHLLNLSFGFIEAALAVEVFKVPGVPGIPYPQGFFSVTRELR